MDIQKATDIELHKIHRKRNRLGYFPNIICLGLSIYCQRSKLIESELWIAAFMLMVFGTTLRILVSEFFSKKWEQKSNFSLVANFIAFAALGIAWGLHFYDIHEAYGPSSVNLTYTFLVIIALITGSSTSLLGDRLSYYTYVLTLSGSVFFTYLSDPNFSSTFIVINLILFLLFSIAHYKMARSQLCDLIVSKLTTSREKDRLVEAQNTIRDQEAKAQYAAKLASLGEMAAGIAHEVNNPLTVIQGTAINIKRLVDEEPMDRNTIKLLSTKMIETSERISKTVKSLKALSRNSEKDPKVVTRINEVINQCIDVSRQRLKQASIELKLSEVSPDIKILGRAVELSQVFINLINNSIDAIKELENRWIKLSVRVEGVFVEISVVDSGNNIPLELRQKIMEPFFTTKDVNQGTGLGLSISKSIVEEHGGELILAMDEPFTTFQIKLPSHS
jgi:signal transduction histidine kinase